MTYHINTASGDFSSTLADDIELGASAWTAGSGAVLRGAEWQFSRSTDVTVDGSLGDGVNTVAKRHAAWFASIGAASKLAVTRDVLDGCEIDEVDITYQKSTVNWVPGAPSQITSGTSAGQIAVHEFGHALGLAHENLYLASMNSDYPNGGDFAGKTYRLGEDDYVALANLKPHSSTGMNLMLARFERDASDLGDSYEVWANDYHEDTNTWSANPGDTISAADGPSALQAVVTGTTAGDWVTIEWMLSANGSCKTGVLESLATRTMILAVNSPYVVSPTAGYAVPATAASGNYTLCAKIDSLDALVETSESDNFVISEKLFQVL